MHNPYASGTDAYDGKKHWTGVWDTSNYSPADPDNKSFIRWLVSSPDPDDVDALGDARGDPDANVDVPHVVIFEGVDSSGNPDPDGASSVKVPKVEVATTSGNTSYYAYWVEDEGVKTDLAWDEIPAPSTGRDDEERAQARRLSAMAAPNYWLTAWRRRSRALQGSQ